MTLLKQAKETRLGYSLSLEDYTRLSDEDRTNFIEDFVYQSNRIEGISDFWLNFSNDGDPTTSKPTLHSHKKAFNQMLDKAQNRQHPDTRGIKKLHGILMEGLLPAEERGHLRKKKVGLLRAEVIRMCPNPESLPHLMKEYKNSLGELAENPTITQEDLLENHAYFEWIHPFIDGNGRCGRLLLNWLSLQRRNEFYVIESAKRQEYYAFLQSLEEKFNKKHPGISKRM